MRQARRTAAQAGGARRDRPGLLRARPIGGSSSVAYGASKGGVNGLGITLANKLAPDNIRVNVVMPGNIDTAMKRSVIATDADQHNLPLESAVAAKIWACPTGSPRCWPGPVSDEANYERGMISTRREAWGINDEARCRRVVTALASDQRRHSRTGACSRVSRRSGFSIDWPLEADLAAALRVKAAFDAAGLAVAQANGWYECLVNPDDAVRSEGVRGLQALCRWGRLLGAETIYVRPGSLNPRGHWWPHPGNHTADTFVWLADSLRQVCPVAESEGSRWRLKGTSSRRWTRLAVWLTSLRSWLRRRSNSTWMSSTSSARCATRMTHAV